MRIGQNGLTPLPQRHARAPTRASGARPQTLVSGTRVTGESSVIGENNAERKPSPQVSCPCSDTSIWQQATDPRMSSTRVTGEKQRVGENNAERKSSPKCHAPAATRASCIRLQTLVSSTRVTEERAARRRKQCGTKAFAPNVMLVPRHEHPAPGGRTPASITRVTPQTAEAIAFAALDCGGTAAEVAGAGGFILEYRFDGPFDGFCRITVTEVVEHHGD